MQEMMMVMLLLFGKLIKQ